MFITEIPYQANSADLFSRFVHLSYAVLLDSCLPQQNQGQFDIISAAPETVITAHSDHVKTDPFQQIQKAINALKKIAKKQDVDLPFTVGAIGYLSYDIGRQLEKIPTISKNDITLPEAIIGIYHWSIVVDHKKNKSYLISIYKQSDNKIAKIIKLLNAKPKPQTHFTLKTPFQSNMNKDFYRRAFLKIKEHIYAGNCYQINFAQRFHATFDGSPWPMYQTLREKHPAPFAAFMRVPNGVIMSLSPERFLKVQDKQVETKPIKGTMPRFIDPAKDKQSAATLLHSEKDRAENLMIVDLLRNDLSRVCKPDTVKVPHLFSLESFSNVHHLVSTITGTLSDQKTSIDLLQHCFPGGSITGAPKISAMKIIESLEPHRRSIYCGSIFYCDINDNFDSNITIRTLIADKNNLYCYAGGGIVYDSDCDKEYDETWAKVGKLIQLLSN